MTASAFDSGGAPAMDLLRLVEDVPIGLALLDSELRYTWLNTALAAMHGVSIADHLGRTVAEVLPSVRATVEPIYRRVLETGKPAESLDVIGAMPDAPDRQRYWMVSYVPLPAGAKPARFIGAAVVEVTDRVTAERDREALHTALAAEQDLLRAVVHQMPTGVIVAEASSGRILLANEAVEQIWRRPFTGIDALTGYYQQHSRHPDGRPYAPDEWPLTRSIAKGETVSGEEIGILLDDGTPGTLRISSVPIRDASGATVAGVLSFEDASEQKRRERWQQLLADASDVLASSLDYETTLRRVVHLTVPQLADYGIVDIVQEDGSLERIEIACADLNCIPLAQELQRHPPGANPVNSANPVEQAIGQARSVLVPHVTDDYLRETARNPRHLTAMQAIGIRSLLIAPLRARGRALGALTLMMAESGRRFSAADVPLIDDLARRAAVAIDNARLYAAEQGARRDLEALAAQRTALIDQLVEGVIVTDVRGKIVFGNEAAARLHGVETIVAAATATPPPYRILTLDGERFAGAGLPLRRAASEGTTISGVRGRIRRPDGTEIVGEGSASPIYAPDGSPLGAVMVLRDVTAEHALQEQKDELLVAYETALASATAARRRLEFIAEASVLLSSSLDYEDTLQTLAGMVVPRLADRCTVDVLEADGTLRRVAEATADPEKAALARALRERYPPGAARRYPALDVARSGHGELVSEIDDSLLAEIAHDEEHFEALKELQPRSHVIVPLIARGRVLGVITLIAAESGKHFDNDDLTFVEDLARRAAIAVDNARLYSAERRARDEAEAALAVRDQFIAIAAHELRTPLTAAQGNLQLLQRRLARGLVGADGGAQQLMVAGTQLRRLRRLVDGLLDVSRIAEGRLVLNIEPVEAAAYVAQVVESARTAFPSHPLTVEADGVCDVHLDPDRFEQVLVNLIENATKYSPLGAPVDVRVCGDDTTVSIAVTDRGTGIPPEEQGRIFERYRRAGNVDRNVAGIGLGLYITREIVHAHGGEVTVESEPGVGSTFTVRLPRPSGDTEPESGAL